MGEDRGQRMGGGSRHTGTLPLRGGDLCLDFANTAGWHASAHPKEWLTSYAALLAWSRHAGALSAAEGQHLTRVAAERPAEARAALARAIALREALYQLFAALAAERAPAPAALAGLNAELVPALAHARVVPTAGGFAWGWDNALALERPLWVVARSAADLLTSQDVSRVRECAGYPCGWLFVDRTRNRSRRWCATQDCGNRVRVHRHHERRRSGAADTAPRTEHPVP